MKTSAGTRGDQWAVPWQFKHSMDSKLDFSLLVAAGMDCDLASPEHLRAAHRGSFQGALQKGRSCGGIAILVVWCVGTQYNLRTNLVL